jgi:hypothetical protein
VLSVLYGAPFEGQVFEFPAAAEGDGGVGEGVLGDGGVGQDQGAQVGERGGQVDRDGADGVVGEQELREAFEDGEVGEGVDLVVGEVDRVELVPRDGEVLYGGDLVPAEVDLAVAEGREVRRRPREQVGVEAVETRVRRGVDPE